MNVSKTQFALEQPRAIVAPGPVPDAAGTSTWKEMSRSAGRTIEVLRGRRGILDTVSFFTNRTSPFSEGRILRQRAYIEST